jgi:hypothetical protein
MAPSDRTDFKPPQDDREGSAWDNSSGAGGDRTRWIGRVLRSEAAITFGTDNGP